MRSTHTQAQLAQVVAGLSEGVILIEADHTLAYANEAALTMHGVAGLDDLGATISEYRANFVLRYRNHREIGPLQHPVERVLAGETFRDAVVEVHQARDPATVWMHRIRSLVLTEADGRLSGLALIMQDVSEHYEAEERFESMFRANPAPAVVCRLSDLRYVKVNQGFIDLTGFTRDQVLGRTFHGDRPTRPVRAPRGCRCPSPCRHSDPTGGSVPLRSSRHREVCDRCRASYRDAGWRALHAVHLR